MMDRAEIKESAKSLVPFVEKLNLTETPKIVLTLPANKKWPGRDRTYAGNGSPRMKYLGFKDQRDHYEIDVAEALAWLDRRWPWWRKHGVDGDWDRETGRPLSGVTRLR